MNTELFRALMRCETDIDGALSRFGGNETLYVACLADFLEDVTMSQLGFALESSDWDAAFTAAHSLKGLAGNMGFVPLFHAAAQLVVLLRSGRIKELDTTIAELNNCYGDIISAILKNFGDVA